MNSIKTHIAIFLTLLACAGAQGAPARQALDDIANTLRASNRSISYIGISNRNELCEVAIWEDDIVFLVTNGGRISADSVFSPYYAIKTMQASAEIEKFVNGLTSETGSRRWQVAISHRIDRSRVDFWVERDKHGYFKSGGIIFNRPNIFDESTCIFKLESKNYRGLAKEVLEEIR